ncbi:MAG: O-antigen ligase family protein [Vicinamibacterales bacterium]
MRIADRAVLVGMVLALAWGVLAFGGVYQWAWTSLLAVAAATGVGAQLTSGWKGWWPGTVLLALAFVGAATVVQLLPLSFDTLAALSPAAQRVLAVTDVSYIAAGLGAAPAAHAISLSPPDTRIALVFLAALAAFGVGVSRWLDRDRIRHLAVAIAGLGVLVAAIGLVQHALSPVEIYGVWRSPQGGEPFGPFVNRNHYAGWMLMTIPLALGTSAGLAVRASSGDTRRGWRVWVTRFSGQAGAGALLLLFGAFLMLIALMLTVSRSGIACAAAAIVPAAVLAGGRRRAPGAGGASARAGTVGVRLAAALFIGLAGAAALWAGVAPIENRFAELGGSYVARVAVWGDAWRVATDFPLTGVGMRAYAAASLVYQTALPGFFVRAAHNDWLQLLAEGGALVGVPAAVLLATLVVQAAKRLRAHWRHGDIGTTYWVRVGAATGLAAILLQSFVDFSLQMPGNTLMFVTLWAIVIAPAEGRQGLRRGRAADGEPPRHAGRPTTG